MELSYAGLLREMQGPAAERTAEPDHSAAFSEKG
jgi:hypothetical protein